MPSFIKSKTGPILDRPVSTAVLEDLTDLGSQDAGEVIKITNNWTDDISLVDLKGALETELLTFHKSQRISKRIPLTQNKFLYSGYIETLPGQLISKRDFATNLVTASYTVSLPERIQDYYYYQI